MELVLIISSILMLLAALTKTTGYLFNRHFPATVQIAKEGITHNG